MAPSRHGRRVAVVGDAAGRMAGSPTPRGRCRQPSPSRLRLAVPLAGRLFRTAPTVSDSGRYVNLPGGAPAFMRPIVGRYEKGEKLLSLS